MLTFDSVSVRLPLDAKRTVHAATHVSMVLPPSRLTTVVGESGCGKSTLFKAALGLLPPNSRVSGKISLARRPGLNLLTAAEPQLRRVRGRALGLIQQSPATTLTPTATVAAHFADLCRPEVARRTLRELSLPDERVWNLYPHELSGGMAAMIVCALALARRPDVLLGDEPTAGLDADLAPHVWEQLQKYARGGAAVAVVTHDLESALRFSDHIAVMYAGSLIDAGTPAELLRRPAGSYIRALLEALPSRGFTPLPGHPPSLVNLEPGIDHWGSRWGAADAVR